MTKVSILLIAANLVSAVLLWFVLLALGARLRSLLRLPLSPTLRWPVDLALGAWGAGITLAATGLVGATFGLALLALVALWAVVGKWRMTWRPKTPILVGVAGGILYLPVALGPPFFYDSMVYHLALPWQVVIEGGLQAHPENLFSSFPPLAQLLAVPPLAFGLFRVPALLHWLAWVTVAAGVHGLARVSGAPMGTARLAAVATMVLPIAPLIPGFPAAEAWLLVGLIPAIAIAAGPCRAGSCALSGLLAGISTAARLQGVPWSALIVLVVGIRCRGRFRPLAITAGCWVAGALPWWFKNLILLHDPTAPVQWQREGIETLWRDSRSLLKAGASMLDVFSALPRLLAPELGWLLPLLMVAVLALTGRKRSLVLGGAVLFGIVAWAATGALPRFLAPTACVLLALASTAHRSRLTRIAAAAAILWCTSSGVFRGVVWLQRIDVVRLMPLDFRTAGAAVSPNDPMSAFGDSHSLPEEARVLFVAEPRSFSFPRRYTAPSQHDPSPLLPLLEESTSVADINNALRAQGYTHLLVNWRELRRLGPSYPVAPWRTPAGRLRWTKFIKSLGQPVVDRNGVQVFQLYDSDPGR
jgi:hypothetical protein